MRIWGRCLAVVGVLLALAGCAGGAPAPAAPVAGSGTFPVTVTHALGTTTIPAEPRRVVALSGEEDTLALLGIAPAAFGEAFGTPGQRSPWLAGQTVLDGAVVLAETQSGVDLERIAALQPDLILATNHYSIADLYPRLSAIAPTIAAPAGREPGAATWQELSRLIGTAVGREPAAEAEIARVERLLTDTRTDLPGLAGKTFTSNYYYEAGTFATVDSPESGAAALLAALGMELSPRVVAEVRDRTVSLEQISVIDADFVAMGYAGDTLRADLTASPSFQGLQAVRAGRVYEMSELAAAASNNPSIQNVPWQIAAFRPTLERVAAGT